MHTITVNCPICGDLSLPSTAFRLVICTVPAKSHYVFDCPTCGDPIHKRASTETVRLILSVGVEPELWVIPAEALEEHTGPALCMDDVLDFVLALGCTDLIDDATPARPD